MVDMLSLNSRHVLPQLIPVDHVIRYSPLSQLLSASISSSVHAGASNGRPPSSGERGRKERNYQKSQAKKKKLKAAKEAKEVDVQLLVKNMRETDSQSTDSSPSLK